MEKIKDTTLIFLVKKQNKKVEKILLAMKKRGFGVGKWNGVGGKLAPGETIEEAARREAKEEIGVEVGKMEKVAENSFYFIHNPAWNQTVHTYFVENWRGEPTESEEMKPEWFDPAKLPFENMWPDDPFWLPLVLEGKLLKTSFTFGGNEKIEDKKIGVVESF